MYSYFNKIVFISLLTFLAYSGYAQNPGIPVYQSKKFSLFPDSVVQNNYSASAISAIELISNYKSPDEKIQADKTVVHWQLSKVITAFPHYESSFLLSDAIYNMSLEEMINAIESDSTFRTGKLWGGVWTRDISYSIILSMAYLEPEVGMKSLLRKVNKNGCIIQDTGTGGAYPCSTDRMIWAVAAWEIFKATGNKDWLHRAFLIIKKSVDNDSEVAYDKVTGLVRGESSFLDWREQTYPAWMQPADIFESECLGTNAVHYEANKVLAEMAKILGYAQDVIKYQLASKKIKNGINKYLWMPDKGYYGQYIYGRNYKFISPRSEALGEALCIIWDIADKAKREKIISNTPLTGFGITCIYPQIPGVPPYHNNAVWPFVETFWTWACVKAGNQQAVLEGISDVYRPAALFLTNKENFVAETGDFAGTQINSSNMLWSLSGNLSIVNKVLFGIYFNPGYLSFQPFIPEVLKSNRTLANFKYRKSVLNITIDGFGNKIKSFLLDGKNLPFPVIPSSIIGTHSIQIKMADNILDSAKVNQQPVYFSLQTPVISVVGSEIIWKSVEGAIAYHILENGREIGETKTTKFNFERGIPAEYQVMAVDKNNSTSFASEPEMIAANQYVSIYQAESFSKKSDQDYQGFIGEGFVEISTKKNRFFSMPITIDKTGWHIIDFRYANGNGPVNTENKCAIRTLKIDGLREGTVVFPQRGKDDWNIWGMSNTVKVYLKKGKHVIALSFENYDNNMNLETNQAMIDYMRILEL